MRWLLTVAAAAVIATGCGPGPLVRRGVLNQPLVDAVSTDLTALRGLTLQAPVPARAMSKSEMAAFFKDEIAATFRPGELEQVEAVDQHLGLLGTDQHLAAIMSRLYEQQIAGFYDPRSKTFTVSKDAPGGGIMVQLLGWFTGHYPVAELLIGHELTHALQDQYFGIPVAPEPLLDSHSDRLLAQRAVFEGDATLAGFAHILGGHLDGSALDLIMDALAGLPAQLARDLPDVPLLLRTPLAFQYDEGTHFAARAFQRGGWPEIDRAHRDPPTSTEQVLHPERYFDQRDVPLLVRLAAFGRLEATGWTPILEDTIGELGIRVLLSRVGPAPAASAADGWNGDRLRAYQRDQQILSVWLSTWDDEAAATEFVAAVTQALPQARIEQRQRHVLVVLAAPESGIDPDELLARAWKTSTVNGLEPR